MIRIGLLMLLFSLPIHANVGMAWDNEVALRVNYGHGLESDASNAAMLEVVPDLSFVMNASTRFRVSARLRGDQRDLLQPGQPEFDSYHHSTRPWVIDDKWSAEVRDAYVEILLKESTFRIGKQQIVWGALDGVKVLDVLNPQSFEQFILEDFSHSRIGLWSAYADVSLGGWRTELAVIPDTTTHYLPEAGAWFEFTAPRYRFGAEHEATGLQLEHSRSSGLGAVGLRMSRYVKGIDLQLVAVSGLSFEPLGRLTVEQGTPVLTTYHQRRRLYGLGLETSFSAFALRAELSYSPDQPFNTRDNQGLDEVRLTHLRGGIGLDWNAPFGVFVNWQWLYDSVGAAPDPLIREDQEQLVTMFLRKNFLYDTLGVELRWYRSLNQRDRLSRLLLSYQVSDTTQVAFAIDHFAGHPGGAFGQFDPRDQISLQITHTF